MKSIIRDMVIYLILGMSCVIVATEVSLSSTWHDALLVIGGVLLGGFCAMVSLFRMKIRELRRNTNPLLVSPSKRNKK